MCLYDKKRFRISKKPIKVWKVCIKNVHSDLDSPFIKTNVCRVMFGWLGIPNKCYNYHGNPFYQFGAGFIHAFQTKEKAEEVATRMHRNRGLNAIVIEGYIPRFIRYAIGTDEDICSRIMILNL